MGFRREHVAFVDREYGTPISPTLDGMGKWGVPSIVSKARRGMLRISCGKQLELDLGLYGVPFALAERS